MARQVLVDEACGTSAWGTGISLVLSNYRQYINLGGGFKYVLFSPVSLGYWDLTGT